MNTGRTIAVLASALLPLAGCADSTPPVPAGVEEPTPTPPPTAAPTATPEPTPLAPTVDSRPLALPTPAVVSYGNVEFEVLTIEASDEDPVSRRQGLGLPSSSRYVYVDLAVSNPSAVATFTVNDRDFLHLDVGDRRLGTQLESDDIVPRSAIRPGAEGTYVASFEVGPDVDLDSASLVLGSERSEQILLPVGGDAILGPPVPPGTEFAASADVSGEELCGDSLLRASPTSVHYAIDLPADVRDAGGLPRRAHLGHVFAEFVLRFEVLEAEGPCAGTVVSERLVDILVEGVSVGDRYVEGDAEAEAIPGDVVTLVVGSMVPASAPVTLRLGNPSGRTADIPIR